jgi:hypothetical protein
MDDYDDIDPVNEAQNGGDPDAGAAGPPSGDVGHRGEGGADPGNDGGGTGNAPEANDGEADLPATYPFTSRGIRGNRDDVDVGGEGIDHIPSEAHIPHPDSFDPAEPTPGLSHKQEQAILALLAEPTVARAAGSCKVGVRTLHRWLREETFGRAYRLARRETFAQAVSLTQRYAGLAVQTLARVMTDETAPVASRVAAATSMLKFARDSIELDDLADRVEALERSGKEKAA